MKKNDKKVAIIGGGPAGLTAAYELSKKGVESIVLEKDKMVGGISKTVNYKNYYFDIGGHRFFTKIKAVNDMWHGALNGDFLRRSRLSRIYYQKKFFYYPLHPFNALSGLGLWKSFLILASYLQYRIFPYKQETTLEQWVSNRFGKYLYRTFFKTYTEKVWGIPCSEIRAEWAAQRIKGLSLMSAIKNALTKKTQNNGGNGNGNGKVIKSLIDSFEYPKLGPGMMWQSIAENVQRSGSQVCLETEVEKILWNNTMIESLEVNQNGQKKSIYGTHFISSMPIKELIQKLKPTVPENVLEAANGLNYRDFITVALIINKSDIFPDNWIYIHDPDVKLGRIQNFKNWSPYMLPDQRKTCLGLEYFCFEGDGFWTMSDQQLIELAKRELETLGFAQACEVEDGTVVRMPKAYPVYDSKYRDFLNVIREFLDGIDNLQLVGRNGMHRYNNMDHSMLTGIYAAENINGANHNLWDVNEEQEYHEEKTEKLTERIIPAETFTKNRLEEKTEKLTEEIIPAETFAKNRLEEKIEKLTEEIIPAETFAKNKLEEQTWKLTEEIMPAEIFAERRLEEKPEKPINFCMITTFYPPYSFGGDAVYVYRLSNELARQGHHVDVIHSVDAYQLLQTNGLSGKYPNHPNVRVHRLKSGVGFLSPLLTQQTGVPFFIRKIKNMLERNRYDVIHYHNMSLIGITALQYGNAIKLYTMHEHWLVCPMHVLWKFNREVCTKRSCLLCTIAGKTPPQLWRYTGLLESMLKHVDCFISPSLFTKMKIRELGLNIPIRHIPNFIPKIKKQDEEINTQNLRNNNRLYFLFVGRLEKIKGLQNLIPVFKKHREYDLLVAGDGEYGDILRKLAENVPNIKFLGKLSHKRLQKLYRDAVAVIVPSICYEVFPTILLESFAMKTPVIVNNLGGMPEMIQDSSGGFLYNNNDELVSAMEKLAKDPDLQKELGNKGYQAYLRLWTEDIHIEKYFNLINEFQEKRGLGRRRLDDIKDTVPCLQEG